MTMVLDPIADFLESFGNGADDDSPSQETETKARVSTGGARMPPNLPPRTALSSAPFDPDQPLFWLSKTDAWRHRDALEGTLIMGAPGAGKTSNSDKILADALLRAPDTGLLNLTGKPEETS